MPNCEGDTRELRLHLAQSQAERFLKGMASVFGLHPHEAVLAAVGAGLLDWAGSPLAVELEGHGRRPLDASIDLSRTVGWFTTRSEERRVGEECVSTCRSRGAAYQ